MTESTAQPLVDLSVHIEAHPETVWGILTSADGFSMWMDGRVTFEPRVGSPFRAEFPDYHMVIAGEVASLDAAERRIGFTWGIESGPQADTLPVGSSLVEFVVRPAEGGCEVHVRHTGLRSGLAAEQQEGGWRFHLSRMDLLANRADLETGLARTLEGWFAAWNERDEATRLDLLRGCCAEDVELRDEWTGAAKGIDLLTLHIANCHRFIPDASLEATGEVLICRGEALVGWRGTGLGGTAIEGFNHLRADPDGTIRRVTGFYKP